MSKGNTGIKFFLKDASLYGLSQVIGQFVGFLLLPLYTNYLSPTDYGIITLFGFFTLFYFPLSHLGIQGAMFRYVGFAESEEEEKSILGTALISVLCIASVLAVIALILKIQICNILFTDPGPEIYSYFNWIVLGAFFSTLTQLSYSYLRIKRKIKVIFTLNIIGLVITISLNILFVVFLHYGIFGVILATALASILKFINVIFYIRILKSLTFSKDYIRKMLRFGLPNVPSYLQAIVMTLFGQFALSKFLSAEDLGLYAVAWKFCLPLQALLGALHNSWKAHKFDIKKHHGTDNTVYSRFIILMISVYCLVYAGLSIWGGDILVLVSAEEFHAAAPFVPFLALIPLLNAMYLVFSSFVSFGTSQKFQPLISFAGLAATVIFSYILIPNYGIKGAAMASAIGWLFMSVSSYFYGQSIFKVDFQLQKVLPMIAACIAVGISVGYLHDNIIIKILVSSALFFFLYRLIFSLRTAMAKK